MDYYPVNIIIFNYVFKKKKKHNEKSESHLNAEGSAGSQRVLAKQKQTAQKSRLLQEKKKAKRNQPIELQQLPINN